MTYPLSVTHFFVAILPAVSVSLNPTTFAVSAETVYELCVESLPARVSHVPDLTYVESFGSAIVQVLFWFKL